MLLLLLLFSTCLTTCFAQTVSVSTSQESPLTTPPFSTGQPTLVVPTVSHDLDRSAILQTIVTSTNVLNEDSLDVVLDKIADMILEVNPEAVFSLAVRSMTKSEGNKPLL